MRDTYTDTYNDMLNIYETRPKYDGVGVWSDAERMIYSAKEA